MSKGIKITRHTDEKTLEGLKGARVHQVMIPSQKYNGFELHNFDNTISSIDKVKGDKLELKLVGVTDSLVFYSAVLSYELVGLAAIADFGKDK